MTDVTGPPPGDIPPRPPLPSRRERRAATADIVVAALRDGSDAAPATSPPVDPAAPPAAATVSADAVRASGPTVPGAKSAASFQDQVRAARSEFESHVAQARAEFDQANERLRQRTGRDLLVAIGIGVVAGAVVIASLIFLKVLFVLYALAAVLSAAVELVRALQVSGRRVDLVPQLVAALGLLLGAWFLGDTEHWILVFVAVIVVVVWRLVAQMAAADGRRYGDVVDDVLAGAFVQLYAPFLGSLSLVLLKQNEGEWWVLSFLIVAVASDTGAYAAGLAFGRHPMAPRISPKKTWEGFAGAATAALAAGVILALFMLHLPWWAGLVIGSVLLATATIGDLGESMVKRDLGIKDMSSWLPGHGGVLDRLDSILPTAAGMLALYYFLSPLIPPTLGAP